MYMCNSTDITLGTKPFVTIIIVHGSEKQIHVHVFELKRKLRFTIPLVLCTVA